MDFNTIIVLDPNERNPIHVQLQGSSISISDLQDNIVLTHVECVKLVEILIEHYGL